MAPLILPLTHSGPCWHRVTKFLVDNSWGDAAGSLAMTAEWFREYVYYVVIDKSYLHPSVLSIFEETQPVEVDSWDPMGAAHSLCGARSPLF